MNFDPFRVLSNIPIQVAVSACLLGKSVRYDGNHKSHRLIIDKFASKLELIGVCPEVGIGLGVPRPAMQLRYKQRNTEAVVVTDPSIVMTEDLKHYAQQYNLEHQFVSGYLLKSKSPSCGIGNTKIHDIAGNILETQGSGVFASEIMMKNPCCAFITEDLFEDEDKRLEFIVKIVLLQRLREVRLQLETSAVAKIFLDYYLPLLSTLERQQTVDMRNMFSYSKTWQSDSDLFYIHQQTICEMLKAPVTRDVLSCYLLAIIEKYINARNVNHLIKAITRFREYSISWNDLKKQFDNDWGQTHHDIHTGFNPCHWLVPFDI